MAGGEESPGKCSGLADVPAIVIIHLPQHPSPSDFPLRGQVAQLVERSPEKAGVGGSIPSLATIEITHSFSGRSLQLPVTS